MSETSAATLPEVVVLPGSPEVVDQVALARLYGEPLFALSLIHI